MRFTTKAEEFELLKADALDRLAKYMEVLKNTNYEDLQDRVKSMPLVKTYADAVERNAAFRSFLYKDKLQVLLKDTIF
jgi:hypothetical protein